MGLLVLTLSVALAGAASASAAIFWVNTFHSVGAANIGAHHAVDADQRLIRSTDAEYAIAVGPDNDIYWVGSTDSISRGHLYYDKRGKLRIQIKRSFITGLQFPHGVAVYGGYIYWVNFDEGVSGSIGRAKLNGTDVNQNFVPNELSSTGNDLIKPCGLAVTSSYIYWADGGENTIARAATATGLGATQFISGASSPCGVAVSGDYIYWANVTRHGTIGRAKLDGSDANNSFITGADGPCGIAIAGGHIYWANNGAGTYATTIGRAALSGSGVTERYVTGADTPCGVAVDSFTLKK